MRERRTAGNSLIVSGVLSGPRTKVEWGPAQRCATARLIPRVSRSGGCRPIRTTAPLVNQHHSTFAGHHKHQSKTVAASSHQHNRLSASRRNVRQLSARPSQLIPGAVATASVLESAAFTDSSRTGRDRSSYCRLSQLTQCTGYRRLPQAALVRRAPY